MSPKRSRTRASRPSTKAAPKRPAEPANQQSSVAPAPRHSIALLVIVLATCLVYTNTLSNGLVFDDLEIIPNNPYIERPLDVGTIFGGAYRFREQPVTLYRPFTLWTFALNDGLNTLIGRPGTDPAGFHLVNLLLHAGVGMLLYVWLVTLRVPRWMAIATAVLFVVHPIHTEAVAAVVGRAEVLAALFGLLFLIVHQQRRSPILCALLYLLALWSKESAIAFFPLAIAMDTAFSHPAKRWPLWAYGAYGMTMAGWLAMRSAALAGQPLLIPFVDNPLTSATLGSRLLTIVRVQLDYLRLQLFPVGLSSDYSYNQIPLISEAANPHVFAGLIVLLLAIAGAWSVRKAHAVVPFAVLGYAILFAPTSSVLLPVGTIMGERLAYSPSIMVCLLLSYGAWQASLRLGQSVVAGFIAVLLVFGGLTIARNRTWADELTFFQAQIQSAPNSAKAHYGLGAALAFSGNDREAVTEYEKAIAIFPYYSEAFFNLGNARRRLGGDPQKVIEAYRNTIRFNPVHADARANLALFLLENGRSDEARPLVEELVRLNPRHPALAILTGAVARQQR
jgi:protein O-mannosyl-transferase